MATTNHTPTIELSQYISTDKTSYLVNYNDDMLKIDTAIATDRDNINTAQNTANTAEGKADTNKLSIDAINEELNDSTTGLSVRVAANTGSINTINSLIGNGEPTTTDKTIIGAINEINAKIPSGGVAADNVSYDNTDSRIVATNVQDAIDEIVASIPSAGAVELQTGTLTAGQTSVTLTFTSQTIGTSTLIDVYVEDGINYDTIATTATTVSLTFAAQSANKAVAVRVTN